MLKKRVITIVLMVAVAIMMMPATGFASTDDTSKTDSNRIIVAFDENASDSKIEKTVENNQGEVESTISTDEEKIATVTLDENTNTNSIINKYESMNNVAYVEEEAVCELLDDETATADSTKDSARASEYYMDTVKAEAAWNIAETHNANEVKVAVLDTGVNVNHKDLQSALNKTLSYDVVNGTKLTKDISGHGTHVAGIIAATSNNSFGTAGVAAGTKNNLVDLMCVNVFRPYGNSVAAYSSDIAKGIIYATDNGAQVINMSLGTTSRSQTLESAIDYADEHGVTVVCAAGNDSTSSAYYPSDYEKTISVIATDSDNSKASYSNYGSAKTLSAPGTGIVSTTNNGSYGSMSGTSMASPVVAATVSMMKSVNSDMNLDEIKTDLCSTAYDIAAKGTDTTTGAGIVNAYQAVRKAAGLSATAETFTTAKQKTTTATVAKPGKVLKVKAKKAANRKAKVTWKKVNGATGYEIYTAKAGKKYKKTRTVNAKVAKATVAKMAKGKNMVKVRAFKTVSGTKVYGACSNASTCKL